MVAYPVGVTGELLVSYAGLGHASQSRVMSLELPNRLNATFFFPGVIVVIMLLYIPLFPPMYLHMFAQRKKVLGGDVKPKKE
jgi:very-long-chain (3R)-3-hydroxyacyl-CoA dehydratase